MRLARRRGHYPANLAACCEAYGIVNQGAHRALADALATAELLGHLAPAATRSRLGFCSRRAPCTKRTGALPARRLNRRTARTTVNPTHPPSPDPVADPPSTERASTLLPEAADGRAPLDELLTRRSIKSLAEPGPTDQQLDTILLAATTIAHYGSLRPWRFIVVSGDDRSRFGDALVAAGLEGDPDLPDAVRAKLHGKAFVAPTFVVIVSSPKAGNVARWEQEASAAAAGYAMALAATCSASGRSGRVRRCAPAERWPSSYRSRATSS